MIHAHNKPRAKSSIAIIGLLFIFSLNFIASNSSAGNANTLSSSIQESKPKPPVVENYLSYVEYKFASPGNQYSFDVEKGRGNEGCYSFEIEIPSIGRHSFASGEWDSKVTTVLTIDLSREVPSIAYLGGTYDAYLVVSDKHGLATEIAIVMNVLSNQPPKIVNYLSYVEYAYRSTRNEYNFDVIDEQESGTYLVQVSLPFVGWTDVYTGTWTLGTITTIIVDLNIQLFILGYPRGTYSARLSVWDCEGLKTTVATTR